MGYNRAYNIDYNKTKCTRLSLLFNNLKDYEIIQHLNCVSNKQGYIKALIRLDQVNDHGVWLQFMD